ncbi:50S ribosomal protein L29 [bacterium]|nr:MAG: 50S ribosomal protein L29 [bacterium]
MKQTKASDLRGKTVEELHTLIADEKAAMYKTRRDMVFRQSTDTAGLKARRHNIARILTVIGEVERAQQTQTQESGS